MNEIFIVNKLWHYLVAACKIDLILFIVWKSLFVVQHIIRCRDFVGSFSVFFSCLDQF